MHEFIRNRIAGYHAEAASSLRIIYGGSLNPVNAAQLLVMQDIDGGLIGRCSLDANDFEKIGQAAALAEQAGGAI
jgi:triosephosphate isomerase